MKQEVHFAAKPVQSVGRPSLKSPAPRLLGKKRKPSKPSQKQPKKKKKTVQKNNMLNYFSRA